MQKLEEVPKNKTRQFETIGGSGAAGLRVFCLFDFFGASSRFCSILVLELCFSWYLLEVLQGCTAKPRGHTNKNQS